MSRFQMIPLQIYNQHLRGHQMSWRKLSKRQKISLLRVCKRLKILTSGYWVTYHQHQKWLTKRLSLLKTKIKTIYEKRDSLFQPTQTKSALKNFTIQYRIKGSNGYDPESFLLNSKEPITNHMINTRQTKFKLILLSMMEKVDLKSGEVIAKGLNFLIKQKST